MNLNILLELFQQFCNMPNKLGYMAFFVLVHTLTLDWVQIRDEFYDDIYAKSKTCKHLYEINQCDSPIPVIVDQCIRWYTCTRVQNISGTLIWAEIIKRFTNSVLALEPHALILITVITIIILSFISHENFKYFLTVLKDAFRFYVICITIMYCFQYAILNYG
jgi:hypothetical protein